MKMAHEQGITSLRETKTIAIIRSVQESSILQLAQALYDGGIRVLEITCNTSGFEDMIWKLQSKFGKSMWIGAGTVIDLSAAKKAHQAGASFFVTPNVDEEVISYGVKNEIDVFSGAQTPTEAVQAYAAGSRMVKIFPSGTLGPQYLKELRGPLSHIPFMAVGGITFDNAAQFLEAGAQALGVGGSLINKQKVIKGDFDGIQKTTEQFIKITKGEKIFG